MQIYDYECKKCGHKFTEMLRIANRNDPVENPCPNCQEKEVQMLMGTPALGDAVRLGVKKPDSRFVERMKQIKDKFKYDKHATIKDY